MVFKSKQEQHLAVDSCLARCYATDYPITALAEFCAGLRQKGWDRQSIHEVENAVLRVLAGVMGRERESLTDIESA